MSKHEVSIHENTGATRLLAPFLGNYVSKETIKLGGFADELAKKCGLTAIQVTAILNGSFDAIEALEKEGLVRVHTGVGTICGVIGGSLKTADAACDPKDNPLELVLRLNDDIRNVLADVVPTLSVDDSLTKLRVHNAVDLAEPRPYNLIHGKHVFRVTGLNMVLTDEGATVYLEDAHGTTFEVVVDETVNEQIFFAHTADLLEPGDYKLFVKSRAGDAEGPLQRSYRKVKYLKVEDPAPIDPPEIVNAASSDEPDGRVNPLQDVQIYGHHLSGGSVQLLGTDGTVKYCAPSATGDDETLTAPLNYTGDKSELARVQVTTAGGTASIEVRFV